MHFGRFYKCSLVLTFSSSRFNGCNGCASEVSHLSFLLHASHRFDGVAWWIIFRFFFWPILFPTCFWTRVPSAFVGIGSHARALSTRDFARQDITLALNAMFHSSMLQCMRDGRVLDIWYMQIDLLWLHATMLDRYFSRSLSEYVFHLQPPILHDWFGNMHMIRDVLTTQGVSVSASPFLWEFVLPSGSDLAGGEASGKSSRAQGLVSKVHRHSYY